MSVFKIKVKTKSNHFVESGLTKNTTVHELRSRLATLTGYALDNMTILSGFPPKPLDLNNPDATLQSIGVNSGDTLLVKHLETKPAPQPAPVELQSQADLLLEEQMFSKRGILLRKIVPSDNSCLFTSMAFVIGDRFHELRRPPENDISNYDIDLKPHRVRESTRKVNPDAGIIMREIIVEHLRKGTVSTHLLDKPLNDYCLWITNKDSWGGAIELFIFSQHYGIEICVVDTINENIKQFGEDKLFPQRVFLIFDGIHYDPLYMEDPSAGLIQTIFHSNDQVMLNLAQELAGEAKSSRQFTDIYKFTLKCTQCNTLLSGSRAAQEHAKVTGHNDFGEVQS